MRPPSQITRRIDPLWDETKRGTALVACCSREEERVVELRSVGRTHKTIAKAVSMSTGWTCEHLAVIRDRCGWQNAKQPNRRPRRARPDRAIRPRRKDALNVSRHDMQLRLPSVHDEGALVQIEVVPPHVCYLRSVQAGVQRQQQDRLHDLQAVLGNRRRLEQFVEVGRLDRVPVHGDRAGRDQDGTEGERLGPVLRPFTPVLAVGDDRLHLTVPVLHVRRAGRVLLDRFLVRGDDFLREIAKCHPWASGSVNELLPEVLRLFLPVRVDLRLLVVEAADLGQRRGRFGRRQVDEVGDLLDAGLVGDVLGPRPDLGGYVIPEDVLVHGVPDGRAGGVVVADLQPLGRVCLCVVEAVQDADHRAVVAGLGEDVDQVTAVLADEGAELGDGQPGVRLGEPFAKVRAGQGNPPAAVRFEVEPVDGLAPRSPVGLRLAAGFLADGAERPDGQRVVVGGHKKKHAG